MNISNIQYSVRELITQDNKVSLNTASQQSSYHPVQVPPLHTQKKQEEALYCWMTNLVKEEGLEEKGEGSNSTVATSYLCKKPLPSLIHKREYSLLKHIARFPCCISIFLRISPVFISISNTR